MNSEPSTKKQRRSDSSKEVLSALEGERTGCTSRKGRRSMARIARITMKTCIKHFTHCSNVSLLVLSDPSCYVLCPLQIICPLPVHTVVVVKIRAIVQKYELVPYGSERTASAEAHPQPSTAITPSIIIQSTYHQNRYSSNGV